MPNNLPHRIEQAGAEDQRALLEEAATSFWGADPNTLPLNENSAIVQIERWRCFNCMLDASAWESATMMLMPEGWTHEHSGQWRTNKNNRWKWRHRLGSPERSHKGWPKRVAECFEAHTPALALLAAILKAKEAGDAD